ncbi:MAG: AbrB/MazE/SpoVT family DNA-binding domain-containing protein [Chloroflexi bacterium]|nr:AbrB/MazE/SpoVT family DNA-binding domain-containing protein [Chloroflexota bacterium]
MDSYVMKVSSNGQVSIPAVARARWKCDRVLMVDFGEYVAMRPLSDHPLDDLQGKYAGRGPSTDEVRAEERAAEAERER